MNAESLDQSDCRWLARLLGTDMLLWSPNIQTEAFRHLDRIFATRTISRGPSILDLTVSREELDVTYEVQGQTRSVEDLFKDEHLSGALVIKDGVIVLERYALGLTPDQRWQSSSMVKSITSTLIGATIRDGLVASLDDPIAVYLPGFVGTCYDGVTIRHLLTMSSGSSWVEDYQDIASDVNKHYIKPIAERKQGYISRHMKALTRLHEPGTQFYYNTGDSFLLGLVISKVTGGTVADYCSDKVWAPSGMAHDGYFILDSDNGQEITGSRCSATLRDYGRFGLFVLRERAGFEQILPEGWVEEATAPSAPNFGQRLDSRPGVATNEFVGYGYQWWVPSDGTFMALGSAGQWLYLDPLHEIVIVTLGAMPRREYMNQHELAASEESAEHGGASRWSFIAAVRASLR